MLKYTIAALGLVLSATAFASEFKIISEQKFYSPDGVQKFDGTYTYSQYSLKNKGRSPFKLVMREKILSSSGKVVVDVSHDGGEFSTEQVKHLGSIYSLCAAFNGQIETLTVKAGTFQTCKRTLGDFTEWHAEGFPFSVKRVHQNLGGLAILEAVEVKVVK